MMLFTSSANLESHDSSGQKKWTFQTESCRNLVYGSMADHFLVITEWLFVTPTNFQWPSPVRIKNACTVYTVHCPNCNQDVSSEDYYIPIFSFANINWVNYQQTTGNLSLYFSCGQQTGLACKWKEDLCLWSIHVILNAATMVVLPLPWTKKLEHDCMLSSLPQIIELKQDLCIYIPLKTESPVSIYWLQEVICQKDVKFQIRVDSSASTKRPWELQSRRCTVCMCHLPPAQEVWQPPKSRFSDRGVT